MSSQWLHFPTIASSQVTIKFNNVDTGYTFVPANTYDGADFGVLNLNGNLVISEVQVTVNDLQQKIVCCCLLVFLEKLVSDKWTLVRKYEARVPALFEIDPVTGAMIRSGVFQYFSDFNLATLLGAQSGAMYRLRLATPLDWEDPVQTIRRYDTLSTATFTY